VQRVIAVEALLDAFGAEAQAPDGLADQSPDERLIVDDQNAHIGKVSGHTLGSRPQ
jgi:hypothetical protein